MKFCYFWTKKKDILLLKNEELKNKRKPYNKALCLKYNFISVFLNSIYHKNLFSKISYLTIVYKRTIKTKFCEFTECVKFLEKITRENNRD